ncbi:DMT family transporter [Xanthomonadaceae bacterium XH05]|nr:DMT family transporter [Xanthomonadaceae bacterium XH05]
MSPAHDIRLRRLGLLLGAAGAVLFSAKAILAKLQFLQGLDALDVLALRMALSFPLFALLAVRQAVLVRRRAQPAPGARDWWLIVLVGLLGYYLASYLDFRGLEFVPVSLERLILFLNPTLVLLLGLFFFGRAVSPRQWLAMGVCYLGVVLVFGENLRVQGDHVAFGSLLVFGSAVSYALYLALSGELVRRIGSLRLVAYAMCVSTLATAVHYLGLRDIAPLFSFPWQVYALALANAVLCTFLPVTFTMRAVELVGPGPAAQLSVLGSVSLLFLGGFVLGEPVTWLQLIGTVVVLSGVAVLTRPAANSLPLPK